MSQPLRVTESPLDRITPPSPATRTQGPVIGIDLGTSFCRVGVIRNGQAVLVPEGARPAAIPAFVGLSPQGRVVVGQAAQRQLTSEPTQTVFGLKRLVAPYRSEEAKSLRRQLRCAILAGQDERTWVRLGDRVFKPSDLLAFLMYQARQLAQNFLGQQIHRAVIAVPPDWDELQAAALADATRTAGLHLLGGVSEPLAVALAKKGPNDAPAQTVLVYDWGGGRFKASLLRASSASYDLLDSWADPALGGMELDQTLLEHLIAPLPDRARLLADENSSSTNRIADAAERAKLSLSDRAETRVRVPFVLPSATGQAQDLDLPLTRAELEALAAPFVDRSMAICRELLDRNGVHIFDVDEVHLAGGQSRMPLVRKRLAEELPNVTVRAENPEDAVALGTVIAGAAL